MTRGKRSCTRLPVGGECAVAAIVCAVKKMMYNSYGSTDCIRFEGIISARWGTPLSFRGTKINEKGTGWMGRMVNLP